METINIHQAKTQLSRLIERVSAGEEIVIARAGRPVARLVPMGASTAPRTPGLMKGRIRVSKDFDTPLPGDLLDAFEGKTGSR
jgi:prevent-host-death family protein